MRSRAIGRTLPAAAMALVFTTACGEPRREAPAAPASPQEATIVVSATDFSPESVTVEANRPVRLHFERKPDAQCAEEVVIADLGIRQPLAANQTTTVELPPQQARTLTFACGMGMLQGKLLVR